MKNYFRSIINFFYRIFLKILICLLKIWQLFHHQQAIVKIIAIILLIGVCISLYMLAKSQQQSPIGLKDWQLVNGVYTSSLAQKISPDSGSTSGQEVKISGKGFEQGMKAYVGNSQKIHRRRYPAQIISLKSEEITLRLPPHEAGTVEVILESPAGSVIEKPLSFTYRGAKPSSAISLNSISPQAIKLSEAGSRQVTLTGSGFAKVNTIYFGKAVLKNIPSDGSTITFTVPQQLNYETAGQYPLAPDEYDLTVSVDANLSNSLLFKVTP